MRRRFPHALLFLLLAPSAAAAQVSNETFLDSTGYATTMVQNQSPEIVDVEIELRHGTVSAKEVTLGEAVKAVVSPSRFQLAPGESQLVRLLVREPLAADSVLRLVTTFTPIAAREVRERPAASDSATAATATGATARIFFASRLITKVKTR